MLGLEILGMNRGLSATTSGNLPSIVATRDDEACLWWSIHQLMSNEKKPSSLRLLCQRADTSQLLGCKSSSSNHFYHRPPGWMRWGCLCHPGIDGDKISDLRPECFGTPMQIPLADWYKETLNKISSSSWDRSDSEAFLSVFCFPHDGMWEVPSHFNDQLPKRLNSWYSKRDLDNTWWLNWQLEMRGSRIRNFWWNND